VVEAVPEFACGPEPAQRVQVTLGHLLSHASGLPAWRPYHETLRHHPNAHAEAIQRICREPLSHAPGSRSIYSDLGFILLGEALTRATGKPLDVLFRTHVATPLGLPLAAFNPGNQADRFAATPLAATLKCPWRKRVLQGQVHDDNAYAMGGVTGHAGLFGTADEVGRWGQALLSAYHGDDRWLKPDTVRAFLAGPTPSVPSSGWVYGLDMPTPPSSAGVILGPHAVGHLGYTGTSVWIDLKRKWVVVLLTNRLHPSDRGPGEIRRFRPRLHDNVARALMSAPGPLHAE